MPINRTLLISGIAAMALAGFGGLAPAKDALHSMTVRAPDGGAFSVQYTGNVPPKIVFGAAPQFGIPAGFMGAQSPFAMFDRISAEMDRQMAAMMANANMMMAHLPKTDALTEAGLRSLPAGGYSTISTFIGNGACMKSVQITSRGDGKPPQVVSHSSGNCGDMHDKRPAAPGAI